MSIQTLIDIDQAAKRYWGSHGAIRGVRYPTDANEIACKYYQPDVDGSGLEPDTEQMATDPRGWWRLTQSGADAVQEEYRKRAQGGLPPTPTKYYRCDGSVNGVYITNAAAIANWTDTCTVWARVRNLTDPASSMIAFGGLEAVTVQRCEVMRFTVAFKWGLRPFTNIAGTIDEVMPLDLVDIGSEWVDVVMSVNGLDCHAEESGGRSGDAQIDTAPLDWSSMVRFGFLSAAAGLTSNIFQGEIAELRVFDTVETLATVGTATPRLQFGFDDPAGIYETHGYISQLPSEPGRVFVDDTPQPPPEGFLYDGVNDGHVIESAVFNNPPAGHWHVWFQLVADNTDQNICGTRSGTTRNRLFNSGGNYIVQNGTSANQIAIGSLQLGVDYDVKCVWTGGNTGTFDVELNGVSQGAFGRAAISTGVPFGIAGIYHGDNLVHQNRSNIKVYRLVLNDGNNDIWDTDVDGWDTVVGNPTPLQGAETSNAVWQDGDNRIWEHGGNAVWE